LLSVSLRQGFQDSFQFSFGGRYAQGEFGSPFVRIHFNSMTYSLALYNKFIQHRSTAVPRSEILPLDIASPHHSPHPGLLSIGRTHSTYKEVDTHILFDNTIISKVLYTTWICAYACADIHSSAGGSAGSILAALVYRQWKLETLLYGGICTGQHLTQQTSPSGWP